MIVRGASGTRSITVLKMQFPTDGRAGTFIMQEKLSAAEVFTSISICEQSTFTSWLWHQSTHLQKQS